MTKEPGVIRVAVGIALKGHTPPESYHDRMMMAFNLGCKQMEDAKANVVPRYEFYWFCAGEIFIPFAREQMAQAAMDHECDYLFMVDDDQLAPPDMFFSLVKHNVDIVGALTFTRNPPHNPVIYEKIEGFDKAADKHYEFTTIVKSYPRNTLVECDAIGFGAVLINTKVLRGIPKPWFMGSQGTGEDIFFCIQAKKNRFKVFMDTSVKMGHLGKPTIITEEYADKVQGMGEKERERIYGTYQKYANFEAVK